MQTQLHGVSLECVIGDITDQKDVDAVANAANAELRTGGGVAGAIHRAAGPELERVCEPMAPIQPGQAVITPAFHLPNKNVIHCLGPVYGSDEPSDKLLKACYRNALELADDHRLESVAFPAISTGAFGFPMEDAARLAAESIKETAGQLEHVKRVRFVLVNSQALEIHERAFSQVDAT